MNSGKQNEIDILTELTGKKFEDLEPKWKGHIKKMFPEIKDTDMVHAYFYKDKFAKPDVVITVNNRSVLVSVKSGKNPSFHFESYNDFNSYLQRLGVKERILKIIRFYLFGKTEKLSNNGEPFTKMEIQTKFEQYIKEANDYFINNPAIVKKIIHHTLIRGSRYQEEPIDFFYYGKADRGFLLSPNEIDRVILEDANYDYRGIHFFALVLQPDGRKSDEYNKLYVRIKWPIISRRLFDDAFIEKYS